MPPSPFTRVPPLAGLCTFERGDAARPVGRRVRRPLKRLHYAFKRLHEIFTARITAEPLYELKTAFSTTPISARST
jgi:hypothetical protein